MFTKGYLCVATGDKNELHMDSACLQFMSSKHAEITSVIVGVTN